MGKEVNRSYANLLFLAGKGDISESEKISTWIGWGSINIICTSGRRSCCAIETNWKGKHYNKILEELCRDNER
jgi:hypothetical protein